MDPIRATLHSLAEPSGGEQKSSTFIINFLNSISPDYIFTNLEGFGLIAGFRSSRPGTKLLFRCELDAVSSADGVKHLCGHDGHMTILLRLAEHLSKREFCGEVALLFQPAEESGEGAKVMVEDIIAAGLKYDYFFALHNNPNYKEGEVVLYRGCYAAASVGVKISITGSPAHAAYPQKGCSPLPVLRGLLEELSLWRYATVVHLSMGDLNFGISPGNATVGVTIRGFTTTELEEMVDSLKRLTERLCGESGLGFEISLHDRFPECINSDALNEIVYKSAEKRNLGITFANSPSLGSDDFALFSQLGDTLYFDIGNGFGHELHSVNYEFNDRIIPVAVGLLLTIIEQSSPI